MSEYEVPVTGGVSDYTVPLHGHLETVIREYPVIPNPEGEPTEDITSMEIDHVIYRVKDPGVHDWARAEQKPSYTKAEVGLGNVDNTADLDKPVSTATQEALQGLASATQTALNGKVDNSTLNNYYTKTETDTALGNKVDKVQGKGLSTNDYDDTAKGIVDGVTTALLGKVDKEEGYGLSQNDYSDAEKAKVGEIDNKLDKTETAVNSNGLVIATPVTDTAPYVYRQTPVKESFKALMHKIVGASVVWNQLVDSNTTSVTIASGHRYIAKINGTLTFGTSDGTAITVSANDYFTDLTAMFGITIADYVYTLEQATAGSGIAWLQSYGFFIEEYYAYQTNKIESGCVSAKKVTGFNQWDEVWELGSIDGTTGAKYPDNSTIRSKNNIKVCPNTKYYVKKINGQQLYILFYDKNDNVLQYVKETGDTTISVSNKTANCGNATDGALFTPPSNTAYILFKNTATSYSSGICFNVSDTSKNGTYEPYVEPTTYPISPITLRGLFKLSTDKLTVNGDEYNADGSVARKYGIVDLGSLNWEHYTVTQGEMFRSDNIDNLKGDTNTIPNIICPLYLPTKQTTRENMTVYVNSSSSGKKLDIINDNYTTASAFKSAMSGVYLIYELITPTTEQTTPFTETEIVGNTEEFIDYGVSQNTRDVAIPVGTDTDYYQEMKLPSLPTTSGNHNLIYNVATGFGWS